MSVTRVALSGWWGGEWGGTWRRFCVSGCDGVAYAEASAGGGEGGAADHRGERPPEGSGVCGVGAGMLSGMLMRRIVCLICMLLLVSSLVAQGRGGRGGKAAEMPRIDRSGAHPTLLVDGAPYLILGAQMNNSSAFAATLPQVWPTMEKLGVNTVEAPVYWEVVEATEGHFDFGSVDMLLAQARQHHVRLILLWFGTWKNGSPGYAPAWVKQDGRRFPLARTAGGKASFSMSPFGAETMAADVRAFTALMQHLKAADAVRTVLLVQVENEAGQWGNPRDHGAEAERMFAAPVPAEVLAAMGKAGTQAGWAETFGRDADGFFSAWAIARYVEQVAAAGKRVYALPLYVNAALKNPLHDDGPGSFESGGPVYDVLPIWHGEAPSVDILAPDIYSPGYAFYSAVLKQYGVGWNPLLVPETGNSAPYARYLFAVLGAGGLGWSPFGMDQTGYVNYPLGAPRINDETLAPYVLDFQIVGPMQREIARLNGQDRVRGSAENADVHTETLRFAAQSGVAARWTAKVSYGQPTFYSDKPAPGNAKAEGEALVAQLGPDEFLVTGVHARVDFEAEAGGAMQRMWLSVEEGMYVKGVWKMSRIWNGDQTDYGLNFTSLPQVLRVRVLAY